MKKIFDFDDHTIGQLYPRKQFEDASKELLLKNDKLSYMVYFNLDSVKNFRYLYGVDSENKLLYNITYLLQKNLYHNEVFDKIYTYYFIALMTANSQQDIICRIQNFEQSLKDSGIHIRITFGLYLIANKDMTIKQMIELAVFADKYQRKGTALSIYNRAEHKQYIEQDLMLYALDNALCNDEFIINYQPKFLTESKQIIGAEALVRWNKGGKIISPNSFIHVFENGGTISKLDFYVLESVCRKQKELMSKNIVPIPISVNFSPQNLNNINFIDKLKKTIDTYKIPTYLIELEFTENIFINNKGFEILHKLKDQGFVINIDDFGSGYSALNLLTELPIDIIKIDKDFITYITSEDTLLSTKSRTIVKKIIELAQELNVKIVAEGVEMEDQYNFLKQCKCDIIQGYLLSPPISEIEFTNLLR